VCNRIAASDVDFLLATPVCRNNQLNWPAGAENKKSIKAVQVSLPLCVYL
jgi:hypothetical protein